MKSNLKIIPSYTIFSVPWLVRSLILFSIKWVHIGKQNALHVPSTNSLYSIWFYSQYNNNISLFWHGVKEQGVEVLKEEKGERTGTPMLCYSNTCSPSSATAVSLKFSFTTLLLLLRLEQEVVTWCNSDIIAFCLRVFMSFHFFSFSIAWDSTEQPKLSVPHITTNSSTLWNIFNL